MNKRRANAGIWIAAASLLASCGKPTGTASQDGLIPILDSYDVFSTSCVSGTISDPTPVQLGLWDCPLKIPKSPLPKSPGQIILEVDCRKNMIRTSLPDHNSAIWLLPGDMRIRLGGLHGGVIQLPGDQANPNSVCGTESSFELQGYADCSNPDQPILHVDAAIWWLGQSGYKNPLRQCALPEGCTLRTQTTLNQCR